MSKSRPSFIKTCIISVVAMSLVHTHVSMAFAAPANSASSPQNSGPAEAPNGTSSPNSFPGAVFETTMPSQFSDGKNPTVDLRARIAVTEGASVPEVLNEILATTPTNRLTITSDSRDDLKALKAYFDYKKSNGIPSIIFVDDNPEAPKKSSAAGLIFDKVKNKLVSTTKKYKEGLFFATVGAITSGQAWIHISSNGLTLGLAGLMFFNSFIAFATALNPQLFNIASTYLPNQFMAWLDKNKLLVYDPDPNANNAAYFNVKLIANLMGGMALNAQINLTQREFAQMANVNPVLTQAPLMVIAYMTYSSNMSGYPWAEVLRRVEEIAQEQNKPILYDYYRLIHRMRSAMMGVLASTPQLLANNPDAYMALLVSSMIGVETFIHADLIPYYLDKMHNKILEKYRVAETSSGVIWFKEKLGQFFESARRVSRGQEQNQQNSELSTRRPDMCTRILDI